MWQNELLLLLIKLRKNILTPSKITQKCVKVIRITYLIILKKFKFILPLAYCNLLQLEVHQ